jgi:hypothetical protein
MKELGFVDCMKGLWLMIQGLFFALFAYLYDKDWIPETVSEYLLPKGDLWYEKFLAFEEKHMVK